MMQESISGLVERFLGQEGLTYGVPDTVVLCGSHATGSAGPNSDVDLCMIGDFPEFRRERRMFESRLFELMIAPWSWYEQVITSYERQGNVGTITVMLATGICVSGDTARWGSLRKTAETCYEQGPAEAGADKIRRMCSSIAAMYEDYREAADPAERRWLATALVREAVDAAFIYNRWWAVKPKRVMAELRLRDAALAGLVEGCLEPAAPDSAIERLCEYVLKPAGGFL